MDQTTGQVLEKSLKKDYKIQVEEVGDRVVSKPDKRPKQLTQASETKVIVEDLPSEDDSPERPMVTSDPLGPLKIASYFSIDTPSDDEKQQLREIWLYAKERAVTGSMEDIVLKVVQIKGKVGQPRIGESYLDRVYRYIKLRKQEEIISQEMKNMR